MTSSISFKYFLVSSLYTLPLVGMFSLFLVNQLTYLPTLDDVDSFAQTDTLVMTKDSFAQTDTPLCVTSDSFTQTDTPLCVTSESFAQTETPLCVSTDSCMQTELQNGEDEDDHYEKIQRNAVPVPSVKAGWFGYAF